MFSHLFRANGLATVAVLLHAANRVSGQSTASVSSCDALCQHIKNPDAIGSLGNSITSSVSSGGGHDTLLGHKIEDCLGTHEPSAIWNIWAHAFESSYGSRISHLQDSGSVGDRVCIDKVTLARLTAAASQCHAQASHGQGSSWSSSTSTTWGSGGQSTHHVSSTGSTGGAMGTRPGDTQDSLGHGNVAGGGDSGSSTGSSNIQQPLGDGHGNVAAGGSSGSSSSSVGSSNSIHGSLGSTSHTTWGHGNVNTENFCFRIKDKRTDRYLTTGGSEYAWAYYPNYYSIFKAHPSKSVEGGYTLTEINRSGAKVNYPVKLNPALGQFKPLYGDKDAIFTFSPAQFGDSCWGVPGKKMSRRHDWGSWGDNYRQASSGEDCADVEIEEADC